MSLARAGPDQPRQPLGAAGPRDDAQQDLGLADPGALAGDPEVGAQRELEAAAERISGNGRHDRLGDLRDRGERVLQPPGVGGHLGVARLGHLLDVSACREHLRAAVDDDGADVMIGGDLRGRRRDLILDLCVQRVHRRAVQPDHGHRLINVKPDELTHAAPPCRAMIPCRHSARSRPGPVPPAGRAPACARRHEAPGQPRHGAKQPRHGANELIPACPGRRSRAPSGAPPDPAGGRRACRLLAGCAGQ